jgi:hypothetical protein
LNERNYYERTFPYSGAGFKSASVGADIPATSVTLVVAKAPDDQGLIDIITMYPADT